MMENDREQLCDGSRVMVHWREAVVFGDGKGGERMCHKAERQSRQPLKNGFRRGNGSEC